MLWLSLTKCNDATFKVIESYLHLIPYKRLHIFMNVLRKDECNVSKEMSSANEGEGMCNPLIKMA